MKYKTRALRPVVLILSILFGISLLTTANAVGADAPADSSPPPATGVAPGDEVKPDPGTPAVDLDADLDDDAADLADFMSDDGDDAPVDAAHSGWTWSGVMATSYRYRKFGATLNDEAVNTSDFQLEHVHLSISKDTGSKSSIKVMPCLTHMETFSVIEARFDLDVWSKKDEMGFDLSGLTFTAGRFLIPFGRFNSVSFPDGFDTLSRPLLYQSHEDGFLSAPNNPTPLFFTQQSDVGSMLSYNTWLLDQEAQFNAYFFVVNGLQGTNNINSLDMFRKWKDNNQDKTIGGRAVFSNDLLKIGLSAMNGTFDRNDELQYDMFGLDFEIGLDLTPGNESNRRPLALYGEYVFSPREIMYGDLLVPSNQIKDLATLNGMYVGLSFKATDKFLMFVEYDSLENTQPELFGPGFNLLDTSKLDEISTSITRYTLGFNYMLDDATKLKAEYGFWDMDLDGPESDRFSVQLVVTF